MSRQVVLTVSWFWLSQKMVFLFFAILYKGPGSWPDVMRSHQGFLKQMLQMLGI
jgi:hypothetical protein